LDDIKKILVDSNIFIFANIKEYPEYPVAKARRAYMPEEKFLSFMFYSFIIVLIYGFYS